tara:strand:- start:260 stop:490 length:231 start_codon:yes stop_codon:yes gene_type:complete
MKLNSQEVFMIKSALENSNIKAKDAIFVAELLKKVNKELETQAEKEGITLPAPAGASVDQMAAQAQQQMAETAAKK